MSQLNQTVDPFWNRDFGWGLVDAYEAVKLSLELKELGLTGSIDVSAQVHVESMGLDNESMLYVIDGLAWSQMGSVVFHCCSTAIMVR